MAENERVTEEKVGQKNNLYKSTNTSKVTKSSSKQRSGWKLEDTQGESLGSEEAENAGKSGKSKKVYKKK